MSDKIELMRLCGVVQSNFSCLSQSESRTQPCHVRIRISFQRIHPLIFYSFDIADGIHSKKEKVRTNSSGLQD